MKNSIRSGMIARILTIVILYSIGIAVLIKIKPYNTAGKVGAYIFLAAVPMACILWKKCRAVVFAACLILTVICFYYNISELDSWLIKKHSANGELINTQSYWYSSSDSLNRDVLLYTLLRNKTAVAPNAQCWYYRFIEMFAAQTETDPGLDEMPLGDAEAYYQVGGMRMRTLRSLLDEETYTILDDGVRNQNYQYLYIDLDGFDEADRVSVLSDDQYNLYLKAYE